jgi:YidC/Oxa1 family membrane protein insertase
MEMVDGPYVAATADSIRSSVMDVRSHMEAHVLEAPSLTAPSTMSSALQVLDTTAQKFGALAASDTISDLDNDGWFDQFVTIIENSILGLDQVFKGANVPGSLGLSITLFTIGVKALLLPVNFAQLRSSTQLTAMQPKTKEIQERYKDTPDKMNLMLAEMYRKAEVNPLLAILPAFAQIPIFFGLYRALQHLGTLGLLDESFLWIPNLGGPTFDLPPGQTLDWLTQGMLSPTDTLAYLSIPAILVATQTASTQLSKVPGQELPSWVNYLPLLTAAFSLNVPSGLAIYWIVNTVATTISNLAIKEILKTDPLIIAAGQIDIDALEAPDADIAPSYQEALLLAVQKDEELGRAFAEMRATPTAVMKYYADTKFTDRLAQAVQAQQAEMIAEQRAKRAEARLLAAPMKPKENICMAVKAGNVTGVKTYLAAGVPADFKDDSGISALHYAAGKGRVDLLTLLADSGGSLAVEDNNQNTLLHYAAGYGQKEAIEWLIGRQVDLNPLNAQSQTPLDLAKSKDNKFVKKETLELLEKAGAKEGLVGPLAPEVLDAAEGTPPK